MDSSEHDRESIETSEIETLSDKYLTIRLENCNGLVYLHDKVTTGVEVLDLLSLRLLRSCPDYKLANADDAMDQADASTDTHKDGRSFNEWGASRTREHTDLALRASCRRAFTT